MVRKMKDSGIEWIGQIPKDWELVPGKYLFKNKKTIVGIAEEEYERLALTLNGVIKRSKINSDGLQPANFTTYQILNKDELVFKLIDLQNISTSRVGISPYKGIVSPAYIILKKANEDVDVRFYYYWYYSLYLNQVFNLLGDAGVRSNINSTELLNIPVPVLSYKSQKFISKELSKIENKIKNQIKLINQQIQTLEDYKKSMIMEAVTKGLDKNVEMKDSGIEWIGEIPKHWEIKRLKYIAEKISKGISPNYTEQQITPVVNQATFSNGAFNYNLKYCSDKPIGEGLLKKDDVLLATTGGGVLGKTHLFEEEGSYLASTDVAYLRFKNKNLSKFVYYILSVNYELLNGVYGKGSTNQTHLQMNMLSNMEIPMTNSEELNQIIQAIDEKCSHIDEAIAAKQNQLETLEEYKKSLIYEYVTGKKEVEDVETI